MPLRISPASLIALLTLAACGADMRGEVDPSAEVFAGNPDAESLAVELAARQLSRVPDLVAGIDAMRVERVRFDNRGNGHVFYQQTVAGVPVWGGEAIVHLDPRGRLINTTDAFHHQLDVDTTPLWSAEEAIDLALATVGGRSDMSEPPTADLWVLPQGGRAHLVWRVSIRDIEDTDTPSMPVVFIDAHDGSVVDRYDNLQTYALEDADHVTYDLDGGTRYSSASVGDSSDTDLLTTYDASVATFDYLETAFGRAGYDDRGSTAQAYGHYSRNYSNAFWSGNRASFGDGNGRTYLYFGTLDVTAHEFGHGVTQYEANLQYSNESGALNEASSDILAAVIQASVEGGTSDAVWDLGEDIVAGSGAMRYMDEPSADGYSRDHYSDRYTGRGDSGGVHYNSGIANHFFYLLSEGGQHHDAAYRTGYSITGIGIEAAYDIWYAALTGYMTRTTDFSAARTATENACVAQGYSETWCHSVSLAWYEVGVGSDPGDYPSTGDTGATGGGDTGGGDTGTAGGGDTGATGGGDTGDGLSLTCSGTLYAGTLSGAGDMADHPAGGAFYFNGFRATMVGDPGTNFDLTLYRNFRGTWRPVDSSTNADSSEEVSSPFRSGYYARVSSTSGSGDYLLCVE